MLIVLEGCDGTGKTTLANKLALILGAEIIHCTTKTPNTAWFFENIIEMSKTRNIIADRFCYGQFVYQEPEERKVTKDELYTLELDMMNAGARVIYVDASEADIKKRLNARGEVTTKPIGYIREKYESLWKESILSITVMYASVDNKEDSYFEYRYNKE